MNSFHVYLFILKIVYLIQLVLIFFRVQSTKNPIFYWSDKLFNSSLALFLIYYFSVGKFPDIDPADRYLLILIGGVFLSYTWQDEFFELQTLVYDKIMGL
jgi:hypothetical protein